MSATHRDNSGYFQPAFVICAVVLALVGAGMSVAEKKLGLFLKKQPLPLKRSLSEMKVAALAPYEVVAKQQIQNEEILSSLGTTDYIQWVLEDPCQDRLHSVGPGGPLSAGREFCPTGDAVRYVLIPVAGTSAWPRKTCGFESTGRIDRGRFRVAAWSSALPERISYSRRRGFPFSIASGSTENMPAIETRRVWL